MAATEITEVDKPPKCSVAIPYIHLQTDLIGIPDDVCLINVKFGFDAKVLRIATPRLGAWILAEKAGSFEAARTQISQPLTKAAYKRYNTHHTTTENQQ